MEEQVFNKTWGSEVWFANNERYCGKMLIVKQGLWSSNGKFHYHKLKDETFFVIEGTLLLDYQDFDGTFYEIELNVGGSFRVPPGMKHRFTSKDGLCRFIEASTQHLEEDSYRCAWDKENEEWVEG